MYQINLFAEEKLPSLLEFGLAGAIFYIPDYPGSDQGRMLALVAPFAFYRGEKFRVDDEGGMRQKMIDRSRWEFDLSAAASFPADSKDNKAREGMPDLDWIGEIGPRIRIHLKEEFNSRWNLNFPLRFVVSTNFRRVDHKGIVFQPQIEWHEDNVFNEKWDLYFSSSLIFSSQALMDYFYEVKPEYETAERKEFDAKAGLMGLGFLSGFSRDLTDNWKFFIGVGFEYYGISQNKNSPLLKQDYNTSFAFGFSHKLWEDDRRATPF